MAESLLLQVRMNDLIDRLRVLYDRLVDENEHADAFHVGLAIEALKAPRHGDD